MHITKLKFLFRKSEDKCDYKDGCKCPYFFRGKCYRYSFELGDRCAPSNYSDGGEEM